MEKQKSLAGNSAKKRRILIGCAIGGAVLIGGTIAIGIVFGSKSCSKVYELTATNDTLNSENREITFTASGADASKITWEINEPSTLPVHFYGNPGSSIANLSLDWFYNPIENTTLTVIAHIGGHDESKTVYVHDLIPGLIINNNIDSSYFALDGAKIYVSDSNGVTRHNKLLNLQAYADAQRYTGDTFVIEGEIDFGFLVGFNQDVVLRGENNSLVDITDQTVASYGIVVGSTSNPASGDYQYTGKMEIASSALFNISSSGYTYGVYFDSTAAGSTQTINGVFMSSGSEAYGVRFNSTTAGEITINGVFTVSSTDSTGAFGVRFAGTAVGSDQIINGTFTVSSFAAYNPYRLYSTYGVYFGNTAAGSTTINGVFTVYASNNDAYGVRFAGVPAGSNQTINGTFTVSAAITAYGVYSESTVDGSIQEISGTFTVYSAYDIAYGVRFNSTAAGSTTINGVFTVYYTTSNPDSTAYGVYFAGTANGSTQEINGTFTVSGSYGAQGVYFADTAAGSDQIINGTFTISGVAAALGVAFGSGAPKGTISFASRNKFVLMGNTLRSCNNDLGTLTNKMKVYGSKADSQNADGFKDYTFDPNISLVTETTTPRDWSKLKYQVSVTPPVYFFMYFATTTSTTIPSSTETNMESALQAYIAKSYAPIVGKDWISYILTAF